MGAVLQTHILCEAHVGKSLQHVVLKLLSGLSLSDKGGIKTSCGEGTLSLTLCTHLQKGGSGVFRC